MNTGSHRRRQRPRSPLWARLLVWVGAVLVLFSGGTVGGTKLLFHRYDSAIKKENLLGSARKETEGRAKIDGPLNFLLLGSDYREGDPNTQWRTDTIMVLHIPREHDRAYLVSIPRDSRVHIAKCPDSDEGCTDKINAAYAFGGPQNTAETVSELTGLRFDGMAIINFQGFTRAIGALGGVHLCVDEVTESIHSGKVYQKGCFFFNQHDALDYVRQRELIPDGDYGRQRHQQQLIKAVLADATSKGVITNPAKVDKVIKAAGKSLTVDLPSGWGLQDLAFELRSVQPEAMVALKVPHHTETIGNTAFEILQDDKQDASALFTALRDETLDEWILSNPSYVNR